MGSGTKILLGKKEWKMKKLRKMIGFLLVLALVWGLVPTSFAEPEEVLAVETPTGPTSGTCGALGTGENIQWQLTPDTEADWDIVQGQPYKLTLTEAGRWRIIIF